MNSEIISITTAQKLAAREKAINHIKSHIKSLEETKLDTQDEKVKVYKKILSILEVRNDKETIWRNDNTRN